MELALPLLHAALGLDQAVIESTRRMIESRGFIGRRSVHNALLPPGQYRAFTCVMYSPDLAQ
jgi:hypothetical protein